MPKPNQPTPSSESAKLAATHTPRTDSPAAASSDDAQLLARLCLWGDRRHGDDVCRCLGRGWCRAFTTGVIIILGIANLVGDGFSMAASNFLGTRTEEELRQKARRIEEQHIADYPEGEREEIRQIFASKGFEAEQLEHVVDVITADPRRWVDTMLVEELGLPLEGPSATKAALMTLVAFVVVGYIPLAPFVVGFLVPESVSNPYLASTVLTGVAFFLVGMAKSWFVDESWFRAGAETLLIGSGAAGLAYVVGMWLGGIVG